MSDQDFFSQYLQPTGTPAAGADDPVTALPSDDDAEAGADAPVGAGMTGPQAVPIGAEPSPHAAGPAVPDDGFDGVPPAGAYPAPPADSTPPWRADPGYNSEHLPPDHYTAPPPPPVGYPAPRPPGGESIARHAQRPGPSYRHDGNADDYSVSQRGYTAPPARHTPAPPPAPGQYDPRSASPRPEPTDRQDWQAGPPAAGYPGGPPPQSPPPPPFAARPGPLGGPPQRHESVGAMQSQVREADFVTPYKQVPERGWRRRVYQTTRINLGLSPAEREWNDLRRRLTVNLRGTYTIAVLQQKGGVSKTTTTVGIGAALARYRDDKVVAIDANPASGNLAKRINEPSTGTWRGLLMDQNLHSYSDFRHYLGKDSSSGLEVLAGDPGDEVITGTALVMTWQRLSRQYPIALLDCGNQMRDDVIAAVLSMADVVVVPTTTRYDGAEAARETLDWLMQHGYPHLVRSAVMVVSNVNKVTPTKAVRNLHEGFARAVRAVHDIPYDPHLSDATAINFDRLAPQTQRAFIETAASIVDGFAGAADKDPGYRPQWPASGDERGQERR